MSLKEVSRCHKAAVERKSYPIPHYMCCKCHMPCEIDYAVVKEKLWDKRRKSTT